MLSSFFEWTHFQFVQIAFLATVLISLICGFLSPIVVLKQRSYLGDALAHLVFPGVITGVLVSQTMHLPLWACLFCGAIVTALAGTFLSEWILKNLKIPPDSAAVTCLSAFFAVGILIFSNNRQLKFSPESLLFGDVLTLNKMDVTLLCFVLMIVISCILFFRKHWDAWLSDPEFAEIAGFKVKALDRLFPILLTLVILSGLFAVGGLMISALITMPAILYQPRSVFSPLVILSSFCCGMIGLCAAFFFNWPVGPAIVLVGFCFILLKLLYAKIHHVRSYF